MRNKKGEGRPLPSLTRKPVMKKYLLSLPVELWERLLVACGNEWGKLAQFIRDAIQEKLDKAAGK